MNIHKLSRLSSALKSPMPEGFDFKMSDWLLNYEEMFTNGCGSAGCAIGLYITLTPEHGMKFREVAGVIDELDWDEVEKEFELEQGLGRFIFDESNYDATSVEPTDVAERIDTLIGTYQPDGFVDVISFKCSQPESTSCTCGNNCTQPCKGQCGYKNCHLEYADFLSSR